MPSTPTKALLDVNIIIALVFGDQVRHRRACKFVVELTLFAATAGAFLLSFYARAGELETVGWLGGKWQDVTIQNGRAYLIEGGALSIVDVATPGKVRRLGSVRLPQGVVGMRVYKNAAYVGIHADTVLVFDISDPTNIRKASSFDIAEGVLGYMSTHLVRGYFIGGCGYKLFDEYSFFDLADPLHPTFKASFRPGEYLVLNSGLMSCVKRDSRHDELWLEEHDFKSPKGATALHEPKLVKSNFDLQASGISCTDASGARDLILDPTKFSEGQEVGFYCATEFYDDKDHRGKDPLIYRSVSVHNSRFVFGATIDEGPEADTDAPLKAVFLKETLLREYPEINGVYQVCVSGVSGTTAFISSDSFRAKVDISNLEQPRFIERVSDGSKIDCPLDGNLKTMANCTYRGYGNSLFLKRSKNSEEEAIDYDPLFQFSVVGVSGTYLLATKFESARRWFNPFRNSASFYSLKHPNSPVEFATSGDSWSARAFYVNWPLVYVANGDGGFLILRGNWRRENNN